MIKRFLADILYNKYSRPVIILMACYVIFNAYGGFLNKFDYILLLYVLTIPKIDENTALKYAFVFGIFYDLNFQIFIGLGVLMFQLFNLIKIYAYQMIDITKLYSQFLYIIFVIALYSLLTMKFLGYPAYNFWVNLAYFTIINTLGVAILGLFIGGRRVLSPS
jgi:cell shape-determining protein MreD